MDIRTHCQQKTRSLNYTTASNHAEIAKKQHTNHAAGKYCLKNRGFLSEGYLGLSGMIHALQ
jgi:hypothetical protein